MAAKLVTMGAKLLRQVAKPYTAQEILSGETKELIKKLTDTMKDSKGVGIAAPQIGVSKQLFIAEFPRGGMCDPMPVTPFFNPVLHFPAPKEEFKMIEGCLSLPELVGLVKRKTLVHVTYLDINAKRKKIVATGAAAAILQHEADHLFGTLYIDRALSTDMYYIKNFMEEGPDSPLDVFHGTFTITDEPEN